jgi:hypothetical protein
VAAAAVLALGGTAAASAATSGGAPALKYWVAATGSASNADTDCATARYSTVQSAVTAAEAAKGAAITTVEICPGTYQEQVTITKSLNVVHAPRSGRVTIEGLAAPAGSTTNCQATDTAGQVPQSVVEICGAKAGGQNSIGVVVSISRITVQGDWPANVCNDNLYGVLVYGGGSSCSGGDPQSGLVRNSGVANSTLVNNDIGVALFNLNPACNKSAATPTHDAACYNTISNSHGYPGGVASADANISGLVTSTGYVGDQAGVSDTGNRDTICHNKISGAGYAPRDKASSLPNPPGPAWVRPVDIYSFAAAIHPQVTGNRYDGKPYNP